MTCTIYYLISTRPLLSMVVSQQFTFLSHILCMEKDEPSNIYVMYRVLAWEETPGETVKVHFQPSPDMDGPHKHFLEADILLTQPKTASCRCFTVNYFSVDWWWSYTNEGWQLWKTYPDKNVYFSFHNVSPFLDFFYPHIIFCS